VPRPPVSRPLVPVLPERAATGVALGSLVPVLTAIAIAGQGFRLTAIDFGVAAILVSFLVWLLRRQLRRSVATAPPIPPQVRLDSTGTTIQRSVGLLVLLAVPLGLLATDGRGGEALLCTAISIAMVFDALQLQRWQRRTGKQVYRDRKIWARGAPFFYLATPS
jgi:hypothetical protein